VPATAGRAPGAQVPLSGDGAAVFELRLTGASDGAPDCADAQPPDGSLHGARGGAGGGGPSASPSGRSSFRLWLPSDAAATPAFNPVPPEWRQVCGRPLVSGCPKHAAPCDLLTLI